ncbi:conjugal transfer pilus assembly protein TraH [Erwinia amylovora]|uniref:conjugal transfer pilus assembly protein TraH n=1 Tax=Erwinia amylovora TaxID=552 RepID=UPI0020BE5E80|nr:conjugal transfer pilus assembly protein TraH [Erwinia amylovora]MCK8417604.1 conjugal transfer protein TraH [Erwinia amylovora]
MKKILSLMIGLAVAGVSLPAASSVDGDLNSFYGSMNFDSNVSKAQAWQGQAANYMTGGSVYLRNKVKTVQLVSLQVPSLNSGCGGIDAYLGAFSFINGAQIQQFAKQIMSNSVGYAFDLALQTMVPELKQAKDYMEKLASDINSSNMSSCQAAQGIVGGMWPRTQVSQQLICQDIGTGNNMFSDWAKSRQECGSGGQINSVNSNAPDNKKDQVVINKNLIWDALGKNRLFDGNAELKQFVMSLVGTIVFDAKGKVTVLAPMVTDRSILNALMQGGSASIYVCASSDSDKCLSPSVGNVTISNANGLVRQVISMIDSIDNKVKNGGEGLTDKEKGFINTTGVPVLQFLMQSNMLGGQASSYLLTVSDYIAKDIMFQYLSELVQQAQASLLGSNYPEEAAQQLRENIVTAQQLVQQLKVESNADMTALQAINTHLTYLQQQTSTKVGTMYSANYSFGE